MDEWIGLGGGREKVSRHNHNNHFVAKYLLASMIGTGHASVSVVQPSKLHPIHKLKFIAKFQMQWMVGWGWYANAPKMLHAPANFQLPLIDGQMLG